MARDGSGNYTLPVGNPVVTGTTVASSWANTTMDDVAAAMQDSLSRSGLGAMTAPLVNASGAVGAPAVTFSADSQTGAYLSAAGDLRFAVSGVDKLRVTAAGGLEAWDVTTSLWYKIIDASAVGGLLETQTLAAAQTVVPFTNNVAGAALYLNGTSGDRGRLFEGTDYTYNSATQEVTLATAYPVGTDLVAVIADETNIAAAILAADAAAAAAAASAVAAAADALSTAADALSTAADAAAAAVSATAAEGFNPNPTIVDKGTVASGTVTFDVSVSNKQKLTVGGALTIAASNWPLTGKYGELEIELVNGGAFVVTLPTVNWLVGDGATSTVFGDAGVALNAAGNNTLIIWTDDAGAVLYGVAG